jgi:UDP-N-acetylmuramyl pentapeptide phosphotransferase/UDP-N-acetylglucosamine-1-phosphate transferase
MQYSPSLAALAILASTATLSVVLIVGLGSWLARYALATPNARSSHKQPTPQGGGIAVVVAIVAVSGATLSFSSAATADPASLIILFAAVLLMAAVGVLADKRPIAPAPRLMLQTFAVVAALTTLPPERMLPVLPWWTERFLLVVGTLWFVNLVNFMDGLDWMTVAEVVPITAAIAGIGVMSALPWHGIVISSALCGATIGFAFFNRPVAKLFLGDVGSLPIGLLLAWLLLVLASAGARTAAVLLPLYYLADSTFTLLRRAINREPVWQAHRSHFYQRATDRGFRVIDVVARVFIVNVALATLAVTTILLPSRTMDIIALNVGAALVACLLVVFARGPRTR